MLEASVVTAAGLSRGRRCGLAADEPFDLEAVAVELAPVAALTMPFSSGVAAAPAPPLPLSWAARYSCWAEVAGCGGAIVGRLLPVRAGRLLRRRRGL